MAHFRTISKAVLLLLSTYQGTSEAYPLVGADTMPAADATTDVK